MGRHLGARHAFEVGQLDQCALRVRQAVERLARALAIGPVPDRRYGRPFRIGRALAQEPESLALDEPTASLDVRHEMSILQVLRAEADRGVTVLLITHHLDLAARFADRMLLLDGGRVAAEGTPSEVMTREVLSAVYRWPLAVQRDPLTGAPRVTPL